MSTFLAFRTAAFALFPPTRACLHRPAFRALQTVAPTKQGDKRKEGDKRKKDEKPRRNEGIKYKLVRLVDPVTKRLTEPRMLSTILFAIDRKEKYVELLSAEEGSVPIVRIMDQKEEYKKEKWLKLRAREVAMNNRHKEVQLTWGSTSSDMAHKLERVRQELEKGLKVDLVFAPKKGQVLPKLVERQVQIQEILDLTADVGKEWKVQEHGRTLTAVFLQGTTSPLSAVQTVQKIPKKIRRKEELRAKERLKPQKPDSDGDFVDIYQD
jgi:translation initiation factor IF-3